LRKAPQLEADHGAVVHVLGREANARQVVGAEQTLTLQQLWTHQVRVAREGGETLIGRVTVSRGTQGEDLPPGLAGAGQGVDPVKRGGAEVADAVGAGQR